MRCSAKSDRKIPIWIVQTDDPDVTLCRTLRVGETFTTFTRADFNSYHRLAKLYFRGC